MPIFPAKLAIIDLHNGIVNLDGENLPFTFDKDPGVTVKTIRGGDLHNVELNLIVPDQLMLIITDKGRLTINEWLCPYDIEADSLRAYSRQSGLHEFFDVSFKLWSENVVIHDGTTTFYSSSDA